MIGKFFGTHAPMITVVVVLLIILIGIGVSNQPESSQEESVQENTIKEEYNSFYCGNCLFFVPVDCEISGLESDDKRIDHILIENEEYEIELFAANESTTLEASAETRYPGCQTNPAKVGKASIDAIYVELGDGKSDEDSKIERVYLFQNNSLLYVMSVIANLAQQENVKETIVDAIERRKTTEPWLEDERDAALMEEAKQAMEEEAKKEAEEEAKAAAARETDLPAGTKW